MYYPIQDPIRWSAAQAAPPRYPHVQLDEHFLSLIPQARRKWLVKFQQHDGVVVDMVDIPAGLRQATAGERREVEERGGS